MVFDGTAGQRISLLLVFGSTNNCAAQLIGPDNTTLIGGNCAGSGFMEVATLPITGTYTVKLPLGTAGSGTLTINLVPADVTGTIAAGGSSVPVATTATGQVSLISFTGATTDRHGLTISGNTYNTCWMYVMPPTGTALNSLNCPKPGGFIQLPTLEQPGTYTVRVVPLTSSTGGLTMSLSAPVTQTLTVGGSSGTVTTTVGGQATLSRFSGTAGQRVFVRFTSDSFGCGDSQLLRPDASLIKDGTKIGSCGSSNNGYIDTSTLATTSTYTIVREPNTNGTGATTVQVWSVPADAAGTTTINGTASTVTTTTIGQNGAVTFTGAIGQTVTVRVTGNSMGSTKVSLLRPDGQQVATATSAAASFNISAPQLTMNGTYTVYVDPAALSTGAATIAVTIP